MADDKAFLTITNRNIYDSIKDLTDVVNDFKLQNKEEHGTLIKHQVKTNGKVKLNRWISGTVLTISLTLIGILISHLNG